MSRQRGRCAPSWFVSFAMAAMIGPYVQGRSWVSGLSKQCACSEGPAHAAQCSVSLQIHTNAYSALVRQCSSVCSTESQAAGSSHRSCHGHSKVVQLSSRPPHNTPANTHTHIPSRASHTPHQSEDHGLLQSPSAIHKSTLTLSQARLVRSSLS